MSTFDAIKVHDLVFLDNDGSLDFDNDGEIDGWHVVTGISPRAGFFTAAPLGDMDHSVYVDDMDIIKNHIRTTAVPGAIEALETYERATQLAEVSNESPEALNEWIEASNDATTKVLAALRAVRGEEISDETHRESVSASNKSHPD